jgi:hypothetical protein
MPNHITNILEITGNSSDIKKMKSLVNSTSQRFSIESFFPINNIANRKVYWTTRMDVYEVREWEDIRLTGDVPNNTLLTKISFLSAWSTPLGAIHKLSKLFPTLFFECKYADEDMGYNCGGYSLFNGQVLDTTIFNTFSKDSLEFAESVITQNQNKNL